LATPRLGGVATFAIRVESPKVEISKVLDNETGHQETANKSAL
jgi:hypothetical protein